MIVLLYTKFESDIEVMNLDRAEKAIQDYFFWESFYVYSSLDLAVNANHGIRVDEDILLVNFLDTHGKECKESGKNLILTFPSRPEARFLHYMDRVACLEASMKDDGSYSLHINLVQKGGTEIKTIEVK